MKFLDVKTDYAFKKVFGTLENKDILISFLNSVIVFKDSLRIKDLTIIDPYNIPMLEGMKDSFVDVKAILDDDTIVIIEMQVLHHKAFDKRVLYNMAKNYSVQLNKNDDYHLLNPVIALSIVDFIMFDEFDKTISNFKLLEKEKFTTYSDDIELVFIELPKFKKELSDLKTIQEKFIYFIKNADNLDIVPKELKELEKAFYTINEASLSKTELEIQHKRKEFLSIQRLTIMKAQERFEQGFEDGVKKGMEKGIENGIEKGIEKGKLNEKLNIIKNCIAQGLDDDTIASITKYNINDIKKLR